jgi:hypothetical protein
MMSQMAHVDSPLAAPPGRDVRAAVRAVSSEALAGASPRDGQRFAAALVAHRAGGGRGPRGQPGTEDPPPAWPPAVWPFAPWQLQEGPPSAPPRVGISALPPGTPAAPRLLLGVGPDGAEARLRIDRGPLAGAEIHLRQLGGGGGIEALVLTRVESSRQTLAVAMHEVARRLQRRGRAFRAAYR